MIRRGVEYPVGCFDVAKKTHGIVIDLEELYTMPPNWPPNQYGLHTPYINGLKSWSWDA